jgi:outer membrane beta-barrel protein
MDWAQGRRARTAARSALTACAVLCAVLAARPAMAADDDDDSGSSDTAPAKKPAAKAPAKAAPKKAKDKRAPTPDELEREQIGPGEAGKEGFIQPSPTVQSRIFTLDGTNEIGVLGAFSLNNILSEHDGGALTYEHNWGEFFAIEIMLGGGVGQLTNLAQSLRLTDGAFNHTNTTDLANAGTLTAYGQVGFRLTPLYGKFNLASELPVHFDIYIDAGGGAAYVTYHSILGCNEDVTGTPPACPNNDFHQESMPTWAFHVGGGIRLFITQQITIRVEVQDLVFPDRYYTGLNLEMSSGGFTQLYGKPGLTQVPLMLAGLGFLL